MRLKLVPAQTSWDFFRFSRITFGFSIVIVVISLFLEAFVGLNFGIDFRGGTTIRTEAVQPIDVAAYRAALDTLNLGDVTITEVIDATFAADQNVASVSIQAQEGQEAVAGPVLDAVRGVLQEVDPSLTFSSVESVGPTVSGELIWTAVLAVSLAIAAVLIYIWLRFEWQFSLGAVA
ncbi:MAG: protein translocase subunit SecF, partial [Pseudomonadota bacterium]